MDSLRLCRAQRDGWGNCRLPAPKEHDTIEHLDLDIGPEEARWQGAGEFLGLILVGHGQSVHVAAAADLELGEVLALGDLHTLSILAESLLQEVADIGDFFRLRGEIAERSSSDR